MNEVKNVWRIHAAVSVFQLLFMVYFPTEILPNGAVIFAFGIPFSLSIGVSFLYYLRKDTDPYVKLASMRASLLCPLIAVLLYFAITTVRNGFASFDWLNALYVLAAYTFFVVAMAIRSRMYTFPEYKYFSHRYLDKRKDKMIRFYKTIEGEEQQIGYLQDNKIMTIGWFNGQIGHIDGNRVYAEKGPNDLIGFFEEGGNVYDANGELIGKSSKVNGVVTKRDERAPLGKIDIGTVDNKDIPAGAALLLFYEQL